MNEENLSKKIRGTYRIIIACSLLVISAVASFYFFGTSDTSLVVIEQEENLEKIENGVHLRTGFIEAPGMQETIANCTSCHSAQLVIQNRMNAESWKATIDWMQETQNLWDLGKQEEIILNYLAKHYAPENTGRRKLLTDIEWYELEKE
ncbi:MAG: hypothetical protein AB8B69_17650 [Chitinophagales bacterium]